MKHRLIFEWESNTTIEEGDTGKIQTKVMAEYLEAIVGGVLGVVTDEVDEDAWPQSTHLVIEDVKEKANG